MTLPHHLTGTPRHQLRRPGRARTNVGYTLARPDVTHPFETTEQDVSTPEGRHQGTAATHQHAPGQWPDGCQHPESGDQTWIRYQADRARREMVLGSIRADLDQQPSPRAARAAGRRWCLYVTQLADDVAKQKEAA